MELKQERSLSEQGRIDAINAVALEYVGPIDYPYGISPDDWEARDLRSLAQVFEALKTAGFLPPDLGDHPEDPRFSYVNLRDEANRRLFRRACDEEGDHVRLFGFTGERPARPCLGPYPLDPDEEEDDERTWSFRNDKGSLVEEGIRPYGDVYFLTAFHDSSPTEPEIFPGEIHALLELAQDWPEMAAKIALLSEAKRRFERAFPGVPIETLFPRAPAIRFFDRACADQCSPSDAMEVLADRGLSDVELGFVELRDRLDEEGLFLGQDGLDAELATRYAFDWIYAPTQRPEYMAFDGAAQASAEDRKKAWYRDARGLPGGATPDERPELRTGRLIWQALFECSYWFQRHPKYRLLPDPFEPLLAIFDGKTCLTTAHENGIDRENGRPVPPRLHIGRAMTTFSYYQPWMVDAE